MGIDYRNYIYALREMFQTIRAKPEFRCMLRNVHEISEPWAPESMIRACWARAVPVQHAMG